MRRMFAISFIVIGTVTVSSQPAPGERTILLSQDRPGGVNVMLGLKQSAFYLGEPSASVPADAIKGVALAASRFTIRTWQEGDNAKVVIYAVVSAAQTPKGELETPIAMYSLAPRQSVRVTETEQWGAAPVLIRIVQRVTR